MKSSVFAFSLLAIGSAIAIDPTVTGTATNAPVPAVTVTATGPATIDPVTTTAAPTVPAVITATSTFESIPVTTIPSTSATNVPTVIATSTNSPIATTTNAAVSSVTTSQAAATVQTSTWDDSQLIPPNTIVVVQGTPINSASNNFQTRLPKVPQTNDGQAIMTGGMLSAFIASVLALFA